ncbi:ATP-binding cassette sub- A member 3 [Schistosoma haematobium]|uniref:ATP-binding cassette sub- A member 3 n=1 Tax=Schistosoma haematobium TaxID=6185 RepID=A0A922S145_SCHHA|nr:ATP-binding cassette sub- A member 3 [Schistosoma haematobium]KAH9589608.1 ATP-binding cassette sub- A member 3 [Schistosoma haematobium]
MVSWLKEQIMATVCCSYAHKEKHLLTWRPPNSSQRWTQIDHIAISHRWRGSIEDCRSFWSTCLDSDHALVRARICLRLTGRKKDAARKPLRGLLNDSQAKSIFQEQLGKQLGSHVCDAHPEAAWNDIRKAVETVVISASKVNQKVREQHWISAASISMIDARKLIQPGSEHNEERSQLKRKLIRSLRNDREQWWVAKAREMEKVAAIGNSRQLFRLVKETGIKKPTVSETLSEKDGHIIHSQSRRLDRWAEHFRDQFN